MMLCFMLVGGAGAFAQDNAAAPLPESAYQYEPTKQQMGGLLNGHLPILIFGVLFVIMVVAAYHYWANGTLVDDMSDTTTSHQN